VRGTRRGMAELPRTYPQGVPCWIDTEQPDPQAASHFYGELFGWTFADAIPPGVPGSYLVAQLDGKDAAAVAPIDTTGAAAAPSNTDVAVWNTYVAVDVADEVVAVVTNAGGRVVMPPEDAGQGGRYAVFTDPQGAAFRVWHARRRLGAQVANVPGAWNFSDLHTADPAGARTFYAAVFGWQADDLDAGPGGTATFWRRPGYGDHLAATVDPDIHRRQRAVSAPPGFADAIAWLAPVDDDETPHWHVTFAVADRDDAVASALRLGATDLSGPIDTAWTKTAVVRDPQGAVFTLSQFTPPSG
jgi:predicted enzyme related to lactoylglutathione lyase